VPEPGKPRLCVIGTSNSAGKGSHAGHLERSGAFGVLVNRSLGFCSSDLFAFRKPALDFREFDLCLLEFACNDGALLMRGAHDARRIAQALTDAVSETTRAGCLPVLLILPHAPFMPEGGAIRRVYARLAERLGVPFLDGYAFLRRLLATGPEAGPLDLFKDRMHISDAVSRLLGRCLAGLLPPLLAQRDRDAPLLHMQGMACRFVPAAEALPGHTAMPRSTALVAADVIHLAGETSLPLRLPEQSRVTALVADFARSRGILRLAGETSSGLGLTSGAYTEDPAARMTLGIYPFQQPVLAGAKAVRLDLVSRGGAEAHVAGRALSLPDGEAPGLTFAGFIVQQPTPALPFRRLLPEAVDLAALIDADTLAEGRLAIGPRRAEETTGKLTY
jgi:hypothetical protein